MNKFSQESHQHSQTASISSHYGNGRSSTPPRQPGNPGPAVDKNFVDDNWDDESPVKKDFLHEKCLDVKSTYECGVRADANWLESNFDDNDD